MLPQEGKKRGRRWTKPEPKEHYPWSYDEDVIHTGNSLEKAEGITGGKLSMEAASKAHGMDMIHNPIHNEDTDTRADEPAAAAPAAKK